MAKRCPPGVLCIENSTILVLFLLVAILAVIIYYNRAQNIKQESQDNERVIVIDNNMDTGFYNKPSSILSSLSTLMAENNIGWFYFGDFLRRLGIGELFEQLRTTLPEDVEDWCDSI